MRVNRYIKMVEDYHSVALGAVQADWNALKIVDLSMVIKTAADCSTRQIIDVELISVAMLRHKLEMFNLVFI
jgi:hypothetical protein